MKEEKGLDNITLTDRELLILNHLAQGHSNEKISEILNISIHTTKAHLESIYEKFDVHNRVQAVIKGIKAGLLEIK